MQTNFSTGAITTKGLEQLHSDNMDIEKTRLLAQYCLYWIKMNGDIEETVKRCSTCMEV